MFRKISLLLVLALLAVACGKKSTVKNSVQAEKLSCAYGDCRFIIKDFIFPLDNSALAYSTPFPFLGPVAGGVVKLVSDIFAKNTLMGRHKVSYSIPIPEIPPEIHSIKLKRFFFYLKPRNVERRRFRDIISRGWDWVTGKGDPTFGFLDKLAVRMTTIHVDEREVFTPKELETSSEQVDFDRLMDVFSNNYRHRTIDTESALDLILLKYHKKRRYSDTSDELYGNIHYLETTGNPVELKKFFLRQKDFQRHFERILLMDKSLLIELKKNPVADEVFKKVLSANAEEIEELGVDFIDTCTPLSCLEINVPDVNLVPIAKKGNGVRLDAVLHAGKVPDSFKLKGFLVFEAKVDSPI